MTQKKQVFHESTDTELYEAVCEKEITSIDSSDEEVTYVPTRSEALKAASILKVYLSEIDEPFARNFEMLLAEFGKYSTLNQLKEKTETTILDYFSRK